MKRTLGAVGVLLALIAIPMIVFALHLAVDIAKFIVWEGGLAFILGIVIYLSLRSRSGP